MIMQMNMMTKQTTARAHVGVFSSERVDDDSPAAMILINNSSYWKSLSLK